MKIACITFIIFLIIFSYSIAADFPIDKGSFLTSGEYSFNNFGGNQKNMEKADKQQVIKLGGILIEKRLIKRINISGLRPKG